VFNKAGDGPDEAWERRAGGTGNLSGDLG